ncbi:MAG: hypothetical protein IT548_14960 [Alphaproteobacteria bacterium]|nr:hypothetical protein [Alphaproteobacteria bacterium]
MPLDDTTPVRADVPISLHPEMLSPFQDVLDKKDTVGVSAFAAGREALRLCHEAYARINDAEAEVRKTSPKVTRRSATGANHTSIAMNYEELADAASRALARLSPSIDRRVEELKRHFDTLTKAVETALDDPKRKTPEGLALASEVRAHLKSLPEAKRLKFAAEAVDAGDRETVAALLQAPPFLSGFDAQAMSILRARAANKFAGVESAQLEAVNTLIERATGAGGRLMRRFSEVIDRRKPKSDAISVLEGVK